MVYYKTISLSQQTGTVALSVEECTELREKIRMRLIMFRIIPKHCCSVAYMTW